MQVAGLSRETDKLAVALDPTPAFVREALDWGAGCLLTHHPLAMEPRFLDRMDNYHEVARLVLSAGAWLYAAHTSLDVQAAGPAGWLARALDLRGAEVIEPVPVPSEVQAAADGAARVGFGLVGGLPAPLEADAFAALLAAHVRRDYWVLNASLPGRIRRVAYCTGSGSSLAGEAFAAGADVFVTGDMKYHTALDTAGCVIDVGHFCLEEEMMRRFALGLQENRALAGLNIRFFPGTDPLRVHLPHKG